MSDDLDASMQLHLEAMNRLVNGRWRLSLYPRGAVEDMSEGLACVVVAYLASVRSAGTNNYRQCLTCATRFRSEGTVAAFSILTPGVPCYTASYVRGVCYNCTQRPGLQSAILEVYQISLGLEFKVTDSGASCRAD